jgi:hypothetical protein
MGLKNQEHSTLYREYRSLVVSYNAINERVVKNKFEMAYLWKYKDDYPADWKRKAVSLDSDRIIMEQLKCEIINHKAKIREITKQQNKK